MNYVIHNLNLKVYMKYIKIEKHKNRKTYCAINNRNIDEDKQDIDEINKKYATITQLISNKNKKSVIDKCYFCNKEFSTKGNLIKHTKNNCKIHKELISQQQRYRELLNKLKNNTQIAILKDKIQKLQEENNKIVIADNNTTTNTKNTKEIKNINVQK